jgi:hypothetical protein
VVTEAGLRTAHKIARLVAASSLACFLVGSPRLLVHAQSDSQTQQLAQQQETKPQGTVPQARPAMPSDDNLMIFIMSTLVALHQANTTGNYSVLREIGAPTFQSNSPAKLAEAFTDLRRRRVDLSRILLFQPKLLRRPEINARGMLRITGFFPTLPERINFDLMFQPVEGRWRLFGISVNTSAPPSVTAAPGEPHVSAPTQGSRAGENPTAPSVNQPPAAAPKAAEKHPSEDVDVRDRIDNPPAPPPAEKPKPDNSIWNPFGR